MSNFNIEKNNIENLNFTNFTKHPHCCPNPPIQTHKSAPPVIPKIPDCYDCGAFNILGANSEHCCPRPANSNTPLPTDCCPYQYKKPGLIICYKKTKYNTPYHVSGAQGPAKFRLMPHNYTGQKLRQTRNQRGRWNHRLSNTKLFPVISECRDTSGNLTSVIQSKNLFINTDYKMPKHELLSYLSRNAKYLHR